MGIDKSNVRFVIQSEYSNSMSEYIQESVRCDRDGESGHCILFCNKNDILKKLLQIPKILYAGYVKKMIYENLVIIGKFIKNNAKKTKTKKQEGIEEREKASQYERIRFHGN